MRTKIPLEELLNDTPQNRSLIRLFEEDTYNLRLWGHQLISALDQWNSAQKLAASAASNLATAVASYKDQKFPLDDASYDIPAVTNKVAQTLNEVSGWMEILIQQVELCVQYPVRKITAELDDLVEELRPNYADALSSLADAEDRFARAGRKDAPRKLEEINNDVFISKMGYHKLALQYCSRMNALQSSRYTQLIEPLLAMLYSFKSYFNVGHDTFRSEPLTSFLTYAQQQMQQIDKVAETEKKEGSDLLSTLAELSKVERDIYYGERTEPQPAETAEDLQKQGYLRIKLKSGLFTSNWEKYFVFTQGANLMWQKADQLAGSLMLDLTAVPGTSAQEANDTVERRFVFVICVPAPDDPPGASDRRWLVQAKNTADMHEWISVINNLSGSQRRLSDVQKNAAATKEATTLTTSAEQRACDLPTKDLSKLALCGQPIQFDLSMSSSVETIPHSVNEGTDTTSFDVRFLGCLEIAADREGSDVAQPAIERVLAARSEHAISESTACRLLISSKATALFLIDREQSSGIKANFNLADVIFWTTHTTNERIFAVVTKSRIDKGSESRPYYMCSVLLTEDSADGADVCKALAEASCASSNALPQESSTKSSQKVTSPTTETSERPEHDH